MIPSDIVFPEIKSVNREKSVKKVNRSGSYNSLPIHKQSQKVVKNASFHFSSPFRSGVTYGVTSGVTSSSPFTNIVKREDSLTSKLQNQSMVSFMC